MKLIISALQSVAELILGTYYWLVKPQPCVISIRIVAKNWVYLFMAAFLLWASGSTFYTSYITLDMLISWMKMVFS